MAGGNVEERQCKGEVEGGEDEVGGPDKEHHTVCQQRQQGRVGQRITHRSHQRGRSTATTILLKEEKNIKHGTAGLKESMR